ncbi:Rpr2-domain-containing protein [Daedalea quercina L-15889]|uniref:Rpr2-domain-containing protein n=1 Tax=Daedalea quercina L-15889 TaxID=1314783 RepID=A0A165SD48_9APHY|nr:Rpr2-domain-containing protein [Daedalea quercina L-15889]
MAKKNKEQEPTANLQSVTNRDILQRLNFLYQASAYLNTIAPHAATLPPKHGVPEPSRSQHLAEKHELRRKRRHPASTSDLSRNYVATMKAISQKATVKMDPTIKRTICQNCNTVLVPGVTEKVRVRGCRVHGNVVRHGCMACGFVRKIPAPPLLDPDAPPDSSSASTNAPATPTQTQGEAAEPGDEPMVIDTAQPSVSDPGVKQETKKTRRAKRKGPRPRLPPLFQRKGHVVFRGNLKLESDDAV